MTTPTYKTEGGKGNASPLAITTMVLFFGVIAATVLEMPFMFILLVGLILGIKAKLILDPPPEKKHKKKIIMPKCY